MNRTPPPTLIAQAPVMLSVHVRPEVCATPVAYRLQLDACGILVTAVAETAGAFRRVRIGKPAGPVDATAIVIRDLQTRQTLATGAERYIWLAASTTDLLKGLRSLGWVEVLPLRP